MCRRYFSESGSCYCVGRNGRSLVFRNRNVYFVMLIYQGVCKRKVAKVCFNSAFIGKFCFQTNQVVNWFVK